MKINTKITLIIICAIIVVHSNVVVIGSNSEKTKLSTNANTTTNKNQKINTVNNDNLIQAIINNDIQKVQQLLDTKIDVNQFGREEQGQGTPFTTPLCIAAQYGYADIAKLLIEAGANVNATTKDGKTPLWIAVYYSSYDRTKIIQLLISSGADVNKTNRKGETPLLIAAVNGSVDIMQLLIAAGANVNLVTNKGKSGLQKAAKEGSYDKILQQALAANADANRQLK